MITREEYNKALDIVEAYHKQLFIDAVISSKPSKLEPDYTRGDLKVGDYLICLKKNKNAKYLTVGKKYPVVECNQYYKYLNPVIRNDENKKYKVDMASGKWCKAY